MIIVRFENEDMEFVTRLPILNDSADEKLYKLNDYIDPEAKYEIVIERYRARFHCPAQKYDTWHELNYTAYLLDHLDEAEMKKLEAIWDEWEENEKSVAQIINLIFNLEQYVFYPNIDSEEEWAKHWLLEEALSEGYNLSSSLMDWLEAYIDFSQIWRDQSPVGGTFTEQGYLEVPKKLEDFYPVNTIRLGQEIDASRLVACQTEILKEQIRSYDYPTFTPDTAWFVLHGFKLALQELGLLRDSIVLADTFR